MDKRDFYDVSIRGMVAYCVMCLEDYALEVYPDLNFAPILKLAWAIVGDKGYIDQNADRYMETIPEYLFEFDDYRAAEFEYLTVEEFEKFRGILNPNDPSLGLVMHRIYDIAMAYAYIGLPTPPREAADLVWDVVNCLRDHGVQLPDFELVRGFSFSEFHGWGAHISPEGLSRVL
jgi:hypothetical protein